MISLVDGTYELIQEPDKIFSSPNSTLRKIINDDLNVNPESENELH